LFTDYTDRKSLIRYSLLALGIWFVGFILSYRLLDQPIMVFIGESSREQFRLFMREITNIGLGAHYFFGVALVYVISTFILKHNLGYKLMALIGKQRLFYYQTWSRLFFFALCIAGIGNLIVKIIFGRQRPHKDPLFLNNIWTFFSSDWDFHSFPSGHTQVMFCAATMFSFAFPRWKGIFWLVAFVIGFTRIGTLYHFPSDVWTGGMIGHIFTLWTLYFFDRSGLLVERVKSQVFSV